MSGILHCSVVQNSTFDAQEQQGSRHIPWAFEDADADRDGVTHSYRACRAWTVPCMNRASAWSGSGPDGASHLCLEWVGARWSIQVVGRGQMEHPGCGSGTMRCGSGPDGASRLLDALSRFGRQVITRDELGVVHSMQYTRHEHPPVHARHENSPGVNGWVSPEPTNGEDDEPVHPFRSPSKVKQPREPVWGRYEENQPIEEPWNIHGIEAMEPMFLVVPIVLSFN